MFSKIKNLFNRNNNKYLGTYKGVDLYDDKEYKVIYRGLYVEYKGDELVKFLQLRPDMFEEVVRVKIVK